VVAENQGGSGATAIEIEIGGATRPEVTKRLDLAHNYKVTTECSIWLRNVVKITDPNKPFY
jgi:hypothetical protein